MIIRAAYTFANSDLMTHLEYFTFILVMTELKSHFDILSISLWRSSKLNFENKHSPWDFSTSYILPLRKFGKFNVLNNIFKVPL